MIIFEPPSDPCGALNPLVILAVLLVEITPEPLTLVAYNGNIYPSEMTDGQISNIFSLYYIIIRKVFDVIK